MQELQHPSKYSIAFLLCPLYVQEQTLLEACDRPSSQGVGTLLLPQHGTEKALQVACHLNAFAQVQLVRVPPPYPVQAFWPRFSEHHERRWDFHPDSRRLQHQMM